MTAPIDPNEPLPTTPVGASAPGDPRWATPPAGGWGPPPGWGGGPPSVPPPQPPRRDRLAIAVVAFIFGGLFLVFFGFLFLAYSAVRGEAGGMGSGPRVGVIEVKGVIGSVLGVSERGSDADRLVRQIRKFADDDTLRAVIVRIDSPGGAVAPSQEIHDEVKRLAQKKTVVCSMGNVAASGGFYIAVACPKIVAEPGTLTGSIGVISQFPNLKGLAQKLDVKMETVKSGKLKDAGNPFADMTPEERAYWQGLIDRVYGQFLRAVAEGRHKKEAEIRPYADGRAITGEEAKALGLVDELGNFYAAIDLAKAQAKLEGEPRLVYPPDDRARFLDQIMGSAAGAVADAVSARIAGDAAAARQPGVYFLAR